MLYVDLFESEVIAMFAYDLAARSLLIRFKTGDMYAYQDVPKSVFDAFRAAASKGRYFSAAIRDRFAARRLAPSQVADIERMYALEALDGPASALVDITALEWPWKASIFF